MPDDNGVTIKVQRKEMLAHLKRVKAAIPSILMTIGHAAKAVLAPYPPRRYVSRASVYGQAFKSKKQRAWFFAQVAEGKMQPYRRGQSKGSETFGLRWTVEMEGNDRVVVGNNATYGPYLMDDNKQSMYMRALGWQKIRERLNEAKTVEIINAGSAELERIAK